MKLSIIIINYKSFKLTSECLDSIRQNPPFCDHEVIVVDNDSRDGSYDRLLKGYGDWARIVESGRNGGFSYGNNVGARLAEGEYLFFLNADTVLKPNVLDEMVSFMDSRREFGAITCRSLNGDGIHLNNGHQFPTAKSIAVELFVRPLIPASAKSALRNLRNASASAPIVECDWISGSGLLMSRRLFMDIGCWDESFFMYMEDVGLCQEIRRAHKKCGVYSKIGFVHYLGSGCGSPKVIFESCKSEIIYARKYLPRQARLIRKLAIVRAKQKLRGSAKSVRSDVIGRLKAVDVTPIFEESHAG